MNFFRKISILFCFFILLSNFIKDSIASPDCRESVFFGYSAEGAFQPTVFTLIPSYPQNFGEILIELQPVIHSGDLLGVRATFVEGLTGPIRVEMSYASNNDSIYFEKYDLNIQSTPLEDTSIFVPNIIQMIPDWHNSNYVFSKNGNEIEFSKLNLNDKSLLNIATLQIDSLVDIFESSYSYFGLHLIGMKDDTIRKYYNIKVETGSILLDVDISAIEGEIFFAAGDENEVMFISQKTEDSLQTFFTHYYSDTDSFSYMQITELDTIYNVTSWRNEPPSMSINEINSEIAILTNSTDTNFQSKLHIYDIDSGQFMTSYPFDFDAKKVYVPGLKNAWLSSNLYLSSTPPVFVEYEEANERFIARLSSDLTTINQNEKKEIPLSGISTYSSTFYCIVPVEEISVNEFNIQIFPNPASGYTTINLPEEITNPSVAVYDLQGRKVLTQDLYQNENVLPLKGLTKGVYIITVKSESQVLKMDKLVVF
ncbi:MAG: T9SS C-terminal target domain-containing protein [Chitinophagaceae bacterium]|nr:MAG: T9SS C-terminal target domain-containing protein [Chitinophagaceae bacterium]